MTTTFYIPNEADAPVVPGQAEPDSVDFKVIAAGSNLEGVLTGCVVTQRGAGANMSVDIAAGTGLYQSVTTVTIAGGNVVITAADPTLPRYDLIYFDGAGAVGVIDGTPFSTPVFPTVPANRVILAAIYVPALAASIVNADIIDKRVTLTLPIHTILSAMHSDTLAAAIVRGDVLVGNSTPKLARVPAGAAGSVFYGDGTDSAWTINPKIAGYVRAGSASVPLNITAGDTTVMRFVLGTDVALAQGDAAGYAAWFNTVAQDFTGTPNTNAAAVRINAATAAVAGINADVRALQVVMTDGSSSGTQARISAMRFLAIKTGASTTTNIHAVGGNITVQAGLIGTASFFRAFAPAVTAGKTVTTMIGFAVENMGTADVTNAIGIDITAQANATSTNFGIRNAGNSVQTGYGRIGAVSAPTNVTDGDFTVVRLFVNNDSSFNLALVSSNPRYTQDSGDYEEYNRASNLFTWNIGSAQYMQLGTSALQLGVDAAQHVRLDIVHAQSGVRDLQIFQDSDANPRFAIRSESGATAATLQWGAGGASAVDVLLHRTGADVLQVGAGDSFAVPVWLRVGSSSTPTNTTAGDTTVVRLKVGDGAFGAGVEFSVKGDGALSGFLRVGSETAPTNTTAGDLTVVRLLVGDAALTAGVEFQLTGDMTASGYAHFGAVAAPTNVASGDLTADGILTVANNGLTTDDQFFLSALAVTSPGITFDVADQLYFDRTNNIFNFGIASTLYFTLAVSQAVLGSTTVIHTGDTRMGGYAQVGSASAPTNTTAGDLTCVRLAVQDGTALSATAGEFVRFAGTMTDTATGAKVFFLANPSISPASDTAAGTDFRVFYMQTLLTDSGGAIPGLVNALYAENRDRNSKAIGTLYGVKSVAMVFDSSSPATVGTVTSASALYGQVYTRPTGTSAGTLTTGRGLDLTDLVHSNSLTITDLYGIDIANPGGNALTNMYGINIDALTRGSGLNIGIKNASNYRGTGYLSLQGATTTPAATTDGDFIAKRANLGNNSAFAVAGVTQVQFSNDADYTSDGGQVDLRPNKSATAGQATTAVGFDVQGADKSTSGTQVAFRVIRAVGYRQGAAAGTEFSLFEGLFSQTTVGVGTLTDLFYFRANPSTINQGTITNSYGLRVENIGGTNRTNVIALDIVAQSGAATLNLGIRNQDGRHDMATVALPANPASGYVRMFALTNTTGVLGGSVRFLDSAGHDQGAVARGKNIIPYPVHSDYTWTKVAFTPTLTSGTVGMVFLNAGILVHSITFNVSTASVGATGFLRLMVWNESGTLIINQSTGAGTVLALGLNTTALAADVYLPAGNYYIGVMRGANYATTQPVISCYTSTDTTFRSVASQEILQGTIAPSSGTAPDPIGTITAANSSTPMFKFYGAAL